MQPLVLNLEPIGTDLKYFHLIDGVLGQYYGLLQNETKALGLASVSIYVYLGRYCVTKLIKGRGYI